MRRELKLPIGATVACPGYVRTPLMEDLAALVQADSDAWTELLPVELSKEQREQFRATLKRGIAAVMEPEVAAECILAAVEADQLYALTHGDFDDRIHHRAEGILAALDGHGRSNDRVETAGDK